MGKVLVTEEISQEGIKYLLDNGHEIKRSTGLSEEELIRDAADCDAILVRAAMISKNVLETGKNLRIVARHGAGYNNVDVKSAKELGIWVSNTPDATTETVAEFTLGAMIAAARKLLVMNTAMRKGDFFYKNKNKGISLSGKRLAVVGYGRIGKAVAKRAYYGLNMQILVYDPHAGEKELPDYVRQVSWDEAFKEADVVTLHMPLTASTKGSIGKREFSLMKKTACLINCARGGIVCEDELTEALKEGEFALAFLDVFRKEPPEHDNELLYMDNVIATPHMASNTSECMDCIAVQAASQICKVLAGEKPDWPVAEL